MSRIFKRIGNTAKELLAAFIGAVVTSVIQLLFLLRAGDDFDWVTFLLAAITGAIIGWGYRLATKLRDVTNQALERLDERTLILRIQKKPLDMLLSTTKHKNTVRNLIDDSLTKRFRDLPFVNKNQYLRYLVSAISESRKYEGVQRRPVHWFNSGDDNGPASYLERLRSQRMDSKTRIFVIKDNEEDQMLEDLDDEDLMEKYWESTGKDVKTYWITETKYSEYFPDQILPKDFALYDEELLIEYDEPTRTLSFDGVQQDDKRRNVFTNLAEQVGANSPDPFIPINPAPKGGVKMRQKQSEDIESE